jgi:thiol-disulfide isomerase/thioredoxin
MTFPRLTALLLAAGMFAVACGADGSSTSPGETDPSSDSVAGLTYVSFDGTTEHFDDRAGTPLVVNFFAEWCVNCIQEMPDFEAVSQELLGEVDFLGISIDRGSAEALALVEATGVTYDVGWDPDEDLYAHFQGLAMPTTAFVDASGKITRVWSGVLDAASLREKIDEEIR